MKPVEIGYGITLHGEWVRRENDTRYLLTRAVLDGVVIAKAKSDAETLCLAIKGREGYLTYTDADLDGRTFVDLLKELVIPVFVKPKTDEDRALDFVNDAECELALSEMKLDEP